MADQIYRILLDDYSCPGFVSALKAYYGTLEHLSSFITAIRNDEQFADGLSELSSCFDRFLQGEKNITHVVAYKERPFLNRAKRLGDATSEHKDIEWEHINTWGCPYYMRCDEVKSSHIWLSCTGAYTRAIKAEFVNLQYKNTLGNYTSPIMYWGFPHQIETDGNKTYSRLFGVEKVFTSKAEALDDMENFKKEGQPDFSVLLEDIFGDG